MTINSEEAVNLTVTGINHTIDIESNIGDLTVSSSNTLIRFAANVVVESCTVNGSDNTAEKGDNVELDCTVQGVGNIGF